MRRFLSRWKKVLRGKVLRGQRGYSLVEVTAVVAIAGVLVAVALPEAMKKIEDARIASALQEVTGIATAVNAYFNDTGEFPTRTLSSAPNEGLNTRLYLVSTDPDSGKAVLPDKDNTKHVNLASPSTDNTGSTDGSGNVGTITEYLII